MLMGTYEYTVDVKGRANVPPRFKDELGHEFIISRGFDKCLFIMSLDEWQRFSDINVDSFSSDDRMLHRFIFPTATPVEPDKQGRMLIPQLLRTYAELEKDIVVVGVNKRAEIWSKKNWEAIASKIEEGADRAVEAKSAGKNGA